MNKVYWVIMEDGQFWCCPRGLWHLRGEVCDAQFFDSEESALKCAQNLYEWSSKPELMDIKQVYMRVE